MLSGLKRASSFSCHSASLFSRWRSTRMTCKTSVSRILSEIRLLARTSINYRLNIRAVSANRLVTEIKYLTWATWMFSFPNSFDKLWDSARIPNLPAANALVTTFPLVLAVAPVKIKAPFFPLGCSMSLSLKARVAPRAKENADTTFVCKDSSTSWGVISKNFFHTPNPALKTATRMTYSGFGNLAWIAVQAEVTSSLEYEAIAKDSA